MATILRNLEHLGPNFALHSGTTQDTCVQNINGISAKLRGLGVGQRSPYKFWILTPRWWLQTNQKNIGPRFHVGPNDNNNADIIFNAMVGTVVQSAS